MTSLTQVKDDRTTVGNVQITWNWIRCPDIRKEMAMTMPDNKKPWTDTLPFPRRWLAYIAIKIIVIALGIYLALRWKGVL